MSRYLLLLLLLSAPAVGAAGEPLQIAVASSFRPTLDKLLQHYGDETGAEGVVVSGATGVLYAQIINGAQFDLLLAADDWRPRQLLAAGYGEPASLQTYALGKLVLAGPPGMLDAGHSQTDIVGLLQANRRPLAIANPATAPFGAAAEQTLKNLGLWEQTAAQRVTGQNALQTFQFYATGNAAYAFVSHAQLDAWEGTAPDSQWPVPQALYQALQHDLLALNNAPQTQRFLAYLTGPEGRKQIQRAGYGVPLSSGH